MKIIVSFVSLVCVAVAVTISSCKNSGNGKTGFSDSALSDAKQVDSLTISKKKSIEFKFATVEANFPSPFEIVNDLYTYKAPFRKELLNPTSNSDKYISNFKKEVNFGIYGIDLAYINFYGQNQEMLNYYTVIQKLSKDLSMDKVFDLYIDRFKSNSNNKDSVISIVDNVFDETDIYLKKNDRFVAASHILAASLIELNYLSLTLLKDIKKTPENTPFFEKVFNENLYLYHTAKLYEEFTDADSKQLLTALNNYKKSFDEIIKQPSDLTPEKITQASQMLEKVRASLIN